jgi:hypothetical protein
MLLFSFSLAHASADHAIDSALQLKRLAVADPSVERLRHPRPDSNNQINPPPRDYS